MTKQKFNVGALVYFVGLDNRCRWAVFGTTVRAVRRVANAWAYELNTFPFGVTKGEDALYRDYFDAKKYCQICIEEDEQNDKPISPKRGGRKTSCDKTSYKMRPLF